MDESTAQAIDTDHGYDCSECYRGFASMTAFEIHRMTGTCQVGQAAGLIGELSRNNKIIWCDVDIEWEDE